MSDSELENENEEIITDIPEPPKAKQIKEKKPLSEERLAQLQRAREKALAVRKANTEARGKKVIREQAKQKAQKNQQEANDKFNQMVNERVEEELKKRMDEMNLNNIDKLLDEKLKDLKPRKPNKKKIVYEDTETESEAEVIKVVRKKKSKPEPEPVPVKEPEPEPEPPPIVKQEPQTHQFNQFTSLLRTIPRANRNPYYN